MNLQRNYLSDFVSLLFPELCTACRESLLANEQAPMRYFILTKEAKFKT